MLEQELAMAHKTIEDTGRYESVVNAILGGVQFSLIDIEKHKKNEAYSRSVSFLDGIVKADSGMEYDWTRTKLAASILNSVENARHCRFVIEHLIYGGDFTT
ncbi:hypothetical protein HGG78_16115 [Vibrio aestuarianus]|uniref:hypothetical protein n=1 Tax=Vibrio aestuarianus TaxID=28171 RepID=UPI00155A007C|nr:hypothetical protein [Vibrio aestuarianus]NGZ15263.1 hypothetical protein [Vibrio aestuarianus]NKZ51411.1 hypothetical protein [Vibrio aestuarianus]